MSTCNYTTTIADTDCVGDSRITINTNFSNLDNGLCNLLNTVNLLNDRISTLMTQVSTINTSPVSFAFSISDVDDDYRLKVDGVTIYDKKRVSNNTTESITILGGRRTVTEANVQATDKDNIYNLTYGSVVTVDCWENDSGPTQGGIWSVVITWPDFSTTSIQGGGCKGVSSSNAYYNNGQFTAVKI